MSYSLELPDDVFNALQQVATAEGQSPVEWIATRVIGAPVAESPRQTLAERFAGRTGLIASMGQEALSQDCGEKFADYLEAKRKAGNL